MDIATANKTVWLKKYSVISGRASRSEYWWSCLGQFIMAIASVMIDGLLGTNFFYPIFILAIIVPAVCVAVRRFHDLNQSGWMVLLFLIPIINIGIYIWFMMPGTQGDNRFGPDPVGGIVTTA